MKQSYLNLNAAAEKIEVNSKNVKQAEESMRMADLRYKGGVATIQEVLDTQTSLTRAKSDYIKALHDYEMAKTDLKKAMGMLVEIGKQETGGKVIFTFNLKEISHRTKISYIKNM